MAEVLVLVDHVDGSVRKTTLELLALASRIGSPSAVFIGQPAHAAAVAQALAKFGAEAVYAVDIAPIGGYLVAPQAEALKQLTDQLGGQGAVACVLFSSSAEGKEVAARLAVKLDSGLITDAVDLDAERTATQSVFAGNFVVQSRVRRGIPIVTVKPNSVTPVETDGAGTLRTFAPTIPDAAKGAQIIARQARSADSSRPDLAEASIVVSGGRGTGGDFKPIEDLADALGAAVGASRAAVDSGWMPHSYQVGQTGKTVSPQLYIANGISGAIQHRAGMQTSKAIIAVNKDAEAPIFELADLGVVGDLHEVLPELTERITGSGS